MRSYIRHPAHVPIEYGFENSIPSVIYNTQNVSAGGLCFISNTKIPKGTILNIHIGHLKYTFEAKCEVVWTKDVSQGYEIGVRFFDSQSSFRMRMVEQICYIEEYRLAVLREQNRKLSWKQASEEWIKKYADSFPRGR